MSLILKSQDEAQLLSGPHDANLRRIRKAFGVEIVIRNLQVVVTGEQSPGAVSFLEQLIEQIRAETQLAPEDVEGMLADLTRPVSDPEGKPLPEEAPTAIQGFRLRTAGQRRYAAAMREHELVFGIGPAGTGKTFLAVLMAVQALKAGEVQRIVLCRPAVEAGESLGFLPGDFQAKVNPYMRPLYDSLYSVLDFETVKKYQEREVVEVAPLAYMRGRTLNNAFIILDEAQNTTRAQMKMFLTRMGERSRIVVTGDVTQIDLPKGVTSGLVHAKAILGGVRGIGFVELSAADIVRHRLVERIIQAYAGRGGLEESAPARDQGGRRGGTRRRGTRG